MTTGDSRRKVTGIGANFIQADALEISEFVIGDEKPGRGKTLTIEHEGSSLLHFRFRRLQLVLAIMTIINRTQERKQRGQIPARVTSLWSMTRRHDLFCKQFRTKSVNVVTDSSQLPGVQSFIWSRRPLFIF